MTIDLGFFFLGNDITVIDFPGHDKFIKNMTAGLSTINIVLSGSCKTVDTVEMLPD